MKEQVQETGVRKWFGDDFINLQTEQTDAANALFSDFGNCVISGCTVSDWGNGTFAINGGIAFLFDSTGSNGKLCRITTQVFAAASFPIYLVQASRDKATIAGYGRLYKDGNNKNIVVEYFGSLGTVNPGHGNYLSFTTATVNRRYRDALQDSGYRFVTDGDKSNWNGKADLTAVNTALNLKANAASPAFTGTPTGLLKAHVGLNLVDNTADSAKPVSTAQATAIGLKADTTAMTAALNLKADSINSTFTGTTTFAGTGLYDQNKLTFVSASETSRTYSFRMFNTGTGAALGIYDNASAVYRLSILDNGNLVAPGTISAADFIIV